MPLKYVAPEIRTCDYCGARTSIPKGLTIMETRRRLEAVGWVYRDFLVLCPRCARTYGRACSPSRLSRIPVIGRLVR